MKNNKTLWRIDALVSVWMVSIIGSMAVAWNYLPALSLPFGVVIAVMSAILLLTNGLCLSRYIVGATDGTVAPNASKERR